MYAVCDIGGTQTRIALAEGDSLSTDPVVFATPKLFDQGVKALTTHINNLLRGRDVDMCAVGIAASLGRDNRVIFNAPNLSMWNGQPLAEALELALKTKVYLENDTAMVALGEAVYGAGKGKSIVVYHTISTGVGGARVVNGQLDEHAFGFEPGHQIIMDPENPFESNGKVVPDCPDCLMFGHLEGFIGGHALEQRYGKPPSEITDEHIWDDVARHLAYGLNNTLMYWSPDIIVLGGGLIVHEALKIDKVKAYLEKIVKIFPELPPIVKSKLGDVGGLYGGLAYINSNA